MVAFSAVAELLAVPARGFGHEREMIMTGSTQAIRTCLAVAVTAFLLKPGLSAATPSSSALDQKAMVGTDIFAPVLNVSLDAASQAKEPLIKVAPMCVNCRYNPEEEDDEPA